MRVHGQQEFDMYARPVVSNDGLSVVYDGYVDFAEGTTLIRYLLVNGVAYSTTSSNPDQTHISSSMSQCLPRSMLPPLNHILSALNDAILIPSATSEGATIKCSADHLFGTKFRGLNVAICASGSLDIHVYSSDMEIEVKYLKKPVKVSAPKLDASAASACKAIMKATVVTAATTALLTGKAISDSSRSFEYGPNVTLSTTSCSCMSTLRPCLFIHGLGINYAKAKLHDSFSSYWGDLSDHAPCCTEFKYMIWNSVETGWNSEKQQQIMCDLATSLTESSSRTDIADTIIVTHSMGGLLLAGAIANGKCTLAESSSWVALSPPMSGSMGSDYAIESCIGEHTVIMEEVGNFTGECPMRNGTYSLTYEGGEMSSIKLNEDFEAAQEVYRARVYAAMCSNWYIGLFSALQIKYMLLGATVHHKSSENDGLVEFQSCAGGLPLDQFSDHYSNRFYVTHLNHADTTFYNGDGIFNSAKMPVKWFECVL
ncbi:unnamed protein product [Peronospora destructor]|uniref:GPI inositol-deacylase n=1 Tax=Peronospora destructor TaxID=86335 RepID=A0AAV0U9A6_9STRA|nr:unnamed protein product [Peronospora destructor]